MLLFRINKFWVSFGCHHMETNDSECRIVVGTTQEGSSHYFPNKRRDLDRKATSSHCQNSTRVDQSTAHTHRGDICYTRLTKTRKTSVCVQTRMYYTALSAIRGGPSVLRAPSARDPDLETSSQSSLNSATGPGAFLNIRSRSLQTPKTMLKRMNSPTPIPAT